MARPLRYEHRIRRACGGRPKAVLQSARRSHRVPENRSSPQQNPSANVGPSDERAAVAQRLRGTNDVGIVFGPVVVTRSAVLAADDGDHEGPVGQCLETVKITGRDNHGDLARRELDVLDHPQLGMPFDLAVICPGINRVAQATTAYDDGLPNAVIVRRNQLVFRELIERERQLAVVVEILGIVDVVRLALSPKLEKVRASRQGLRCSQQAAAQPLAVVIYIVLVDGFDQRLCASAHGMVIAKVRHEQTPKSGCGSLSQIDPRYFDLFPCTLHYVWLDLRVSLELLPRRKVANDGRADNLFIGVERMAPSLKFPGSLSFPINARCSSRARERREDASLSVPSVARIRNCMQGSLCCPNARKLGIGIAGPATPRSWRTASVVWRNTEIVRFMRLAVIGSSLKAHVGAFDHLGGLRGVSLDEFCKLRRR